MVLRANDKVGTNAYNCNGLNHWTLCHLWSDIQNTTQSQTGDEALLNKAIPYIDRSKVVRDRLADGECQIHNRSLDGVRGARALARDGYNYACKPQNQPAHASGFDVAGCGPANMNWPTLHGRVRRDAHGHPRNLIINGVWYKQ